MVEITALWLPIVLSAVAVFIASALVWMCLPLHKKDYVPLPAEDPILEAVRAQDLASGRYVFPWCQPGKEPSEAVAQKLAQGPWGTLLIAAGPPKMGKMLGVWMLNLLIMGVFVAYVTGRAKGPGAAYLGVFQIAGAVAFIGYAGSAIQKAVWEGKPWRMVPGELLDGVIYACLTAGVFAWLWPAA